MSKDNKRYYIAYLVRNQFGGLTPISVELKKDKAEAINFFESEKCSNERKRGFFSQVIEVYVEDGTEKYNVIRS